MKKNISTRIDDSLYKEIENIANNKGTSVYKVIEVALKIGIKYLKAKRLDTHTVLQLLIDTYNAENNQKLTT